MRILDESRGTSVSFKNFEYGHSLFSNWTVVKVHNLNLIIYSSMKFCDTMMPLVLSKLNSQLERRTLILVSPMTHLRP